MAETRRSLPVGTVTFLFSDIEGSTRLAQHLDAVTYRDLIEQHHRLLRASFDAHDGVELGTQGDGFLVVFEDASSAVAAAVDAQHAVSRASWPGAVRVSVRIGIHTGEAARGGDDYVGVEVNRAARIASAAHGGQVLVSDSARALAERSLPEGATLHDVGDHHLEGLEGPEPLHQLTIHDLISEFPPLRTPGARKAHLPPRLTRFLGRSKEIAELEPLLAENRLVVVSGPGGTGKTALAIELARRVAASFRDGAWFVDLGRLSDSGLVASTVARSLGLRQHSDQPIVDRIKDYLGRRQLLLVVDNLEHLLEAKWVVEELLAAAPELKVIITSRASPDLYGQQEYRVPPLSLPDPRETDPESLQAYEAVALFVERARAVEPGFRLSRENAAAVAQICLRLDGLPLAIELAASQIRLLLPHEILARLDQRLSLATPATNVPARQQTLERAIEWSHDLLEATEQQLFARLSVFAGGFTLEAAEPVGSPRNEPGIDVFAGLATLVRHSLVQRQPVSGASRFEMLETVREYGQGQLESGGDSGEVGRRHLSYFCGLAEHAESNLMGPQQVSWLDTLEMEHDNLRAAMKHAQNTGAVDTGLRVAASLWRFWFERGYLHEGRRWLESLLDSQSDEIPPQTRAKAYTALGGLSFWLSDAEATENAYEKAAELYRRVGDGTAQAEAAYNLAFVPAMKGEAAEALRRLGASLAAALKAGTPHLVARNQVALGTASLLAGDVEGAETQLEAALTAFRQAGDHFHIAWAIGSLGQACFSMGRPDDGRAALVEALQLYSEVNNQPGIGLALNVMSALESSTGRHDEAARLMGAANSIKEATGAWTPVPIAGVTDAEMTTRRALGEDAFRQAVAEGSRMTMGEAVAYATTLCE